MKTLKGRARVGVERVALLLIAVTAIAIHAPDAGAGSGGVAGSAGGRAPGQTDPKSSESKNPEKSPRESLQELRKRALREKAQPEPGKPQVRQALEEPPEDDSKDAAGAGDDPEQDPAARRGARRRQPTRRPPATARTDANTEAAPSGSGPVATPPVEQADTEGRTPINIPPTVEPVPPEERMYSFSIKDGTYEQLIAGVARQTGLGVIGDAPAEGKVTFITDEELSFDELLARVRMLLFKYKPHEPYWLLREATHLEVIRVNDIYRIMPQDRMFRSVAEFRAANLPEHELALVKLTPDAGSVADMSVIRDFMPDYVRVTPLEDENTLIIFGLVSDIEKYFWLKDFFVTGANSDPRTIETIPVDFITPTEAVQMLGELMQLDGSQRPATRAITRGAARDPSPLASLPAPEVKILASDAQGVIIVRAMRDKIEEIKLLLPFLDVESDVAYNPVVINVKHADPADLVAAIQQVLGATSAASAIPGARAPAPRRRRTSRPVSRAGQKSVSVVTADDVKLFSHPTQSAIVVIANDDGVAKIREYVDLFDVAEDIVERARIELQFVSASEIVSTLQELMGVAQPSRAAADASAPQIVADPSERVIWFTGRTADLGTLREIVAVMDSAEDAVSLHIIRLVNQTPSFVASILQDMIAMGGTSGGGSAPKSRPAIRRGRRRTATPARGVGQAGAGSSSVKITPDDAQGRLFVLCTDAEWEEYKPIIEELDRVKAGQEFHRLAVQNIAPEAAIAKVSALFGGGDPRAARAGGGMRFEAATGAILVMGATEAEIETINELLKQFDTSVDIEQRTFVIRYADPAEVAETVRALVGGSAGGGAPTATVRPRGRRGRAPRAAGPVGDGDLNIVVLGDKLVVQAPPDLMEEVAALIEEFDVSQRDSQIRVYDDFAAGTNIEAIAETLAGAFKEPRRAPRGKPQAPAVAPEFIPQPGAGRLVVLAPPTLFAEIEELLEVLRVERSADPLLTAFIDIMFADPAEVVEQITPLLALAVERFKSEGSLSGPLDEVSLPAAGQQVARRRAQAAAPGLGASADLPFHLSADDRNSRIIIAAPEIVIEEARRLVTEFDLPAAESDVDVRVVNVEHAAPAQLIETVEPLLTLKVDQLLRNGKLRLPRSNPSAVPTPPRQARRPRGPAQGDDAVGYHLAPLGQDDAIVVSGPTLVVDEAVALIAQFDNPRAMGDSVEVVFVDVEHADPASLIEEVTPLLDMRLRQMLATEELESPMPVPVGADMPRQMRAARGRGTSKQYELVADLRNNRVAVAAVQQVIDEAVKLITQFDLAYDDAIDFRTIALKNSDPAAMVTAIQQLLGARPRIPRIRGRPVTPAQPTSPDTGGGFTIVESPGGGAVVLQGPKDMVAQAAEWVAVLDEESAGGRVIKTYEIHRADLSQLVDLIMADVGTTPEPGAPRMPARRAPKGMEKDFKDDDDDFEVVKTRTGPDIYIQADLIDNTLIVSASRAKIARIDEIVAQVDAEDSAIIPEKKDVPTFTYQLLYADAFDAMYDLEGLLGVKWKPSNDLPKVDYWAPGNLLVIKYPHEDRFPEIEELIAKFIDKPSFEGSKKVAVAPPAGVSPSQMLQWFQTNHPEIEFEIIDTERTEDETWVEQVQPLRAAEGNPCVLPASFGRLAGTVLASAARQVDPQVEEEPPPNGDQGTVDALPPEEEQPYEQVDEDAGLYDEPPPTADDMLRDVARSLPKEDDDRDGGDDEEKKQRKGVDKSRPPKKLKAYLDPERGVIYMEGAASVLEDIPDWIDELKKATEDLPEPPPDIRIFRVRYIDVYDAADILDEMFNATRQQRQAAQRADQMARQQQLQAQRQQLRQQQQQQARSQAAGVAQDRAEQARQLQQQANVVQLPPQSIRIEPNPRDRTLIIRAEKTQFAAVTKLLATIDQPKPIESVHRIYPLEKLNAGEVEELLRDWLGLDQVRSARTEQAAAQAQRARGRAPTQAPSRQVESAGGLPTDIMEKMTAGGELGVNPRDIKLSSNEETNTILVMAPTAALDYIGRLIDELESRDVPERVWKDYELKFADVEQVEEYLTSRFVEEEAEAPVHGKRRASRRPAPTKPPIDAPTFVAYPRLKLLSVQATAETLKEIDDLIETLDIDTADLRFESVELRHADAAVVAEFLTTMFGAGEAPRRGRPGVRGAPPPSEDIGPKFVGEEGGTILYFRAPARLHERILKVVEELEGQYAHRDKPRVIKLEHARASDVAEAVEAAYGGGGAKPRGRRGAAAQPAAPTGRFSIAADDATKQLFVIANDDLFADIVSLAKSLDVVRSLDVQFKIYPLEYADARKVYTTLDKLISDYIRRLPREAATMEPFSVEVDDKANALIVLGGPVVFGFVEEALTSVDIPANAKSPPSVLMVPLKNASADEVAQNIRQLWAQKDQKSTQTPPVAEANRALNILIVRGTKDQIDEIKKELIDPLEEQQAQALTSATIPVVNLRVENVAETLAKVFEDREEARKSGAGRDARQAPAHETTVVITPDVHTNQLIVQASEENMTFIRERLAEIDTEQVAAATKPVTKVYPIRNADPNAVVNIIKEWNQQRPQQRGARGAAGGGAGSPHDVVLAVAEPLTRTVVVTASPTNHEQIGNMLGDLDDDEKIQHQKSHVVRIENADASAVATTLTDIFIKSQPRQQGGQAAPISIAALQGSNSLLIKCGDEDFAEIATVVEQLDSERMKGEEVRVVELLYGDATEVHEALKEYLRKPGSQAGRGPTDLVGDVRVSVLAQGNAIVVSGEKEKVESIATVIGELDTGAKGNVPKIMVLAHAKVGQVLSSLREMFVEQQRGGARSVPPPVIVGNDVLNALVIRAAPTDLTAIETVVARLDIPEAADKDNFRLIKVAPGLNVLDLADAVQTSVNEGAAKQAPEGREPPSITITPYKRTQQVIVAGSPNLFDDAEKLIRAMEETSGTSGIGIRIITLGNLPADEVLRVIDQLKGESAASGRSRGSAGSGRRTTPSTRRPSTTPRRAPTRTRRP